mmetsp:Transcript_38716/g.76225  ORF Transcript_38716/g.76225 Transcript_38716/m.76225 type:complete len:511 (+) Transcript_38716:24-1556(+)|eukprot:CAMPEP_0175139196 /NCGR_PEP_ID=MMETSP0087-20121206/10766_1 /TAXON_ID=136419 /ORGANISM="Unknown Unknown, Strain D1" /LENGTH=510 /DNA_ID=CAMNT_0016422175 /DNA_START=24 /DNA_END=1556 /DNA_ORIENTATION=-
MPVTPENVDKNDFSFSFLSDITTTVVQLLHTPEADAVFTRFHKFLGACGVPPPYAGPEELLLTVMTCVGTLFLYWLLLGRRHRRSRQDLQGDLQAAKRLVEELEQQHAEAAERERAETHNAKPVRIWMDGAFDMMHYGHMNAFRQGKNLGTYLIVGINSDKSIRKCKGSSPVMTDQERCTMVEGCKFVDQVVPECPYVMDREYLETVVFGKYNVDYVVHGDDPCLDVDGNDVYDSAKRMGKYRSIARTEGVSTTDIVGRMLLLTKSHHRNYTGETPERVSKASQASWGTLMNRKSQFLTTNRMLRLFSAGYKEASPGAKIIYVDGAFDMFHAGHVKFLAQCKQMGDYLIVGVHNDQIVNKTRGSNMPILNLHERVLSVLGCKHVDDVLIDCPWVINEQMLKSLNIHLVVAGSHSDNVEDAETDAHYQVPKQLGKFKCVQSPSTLDVTTIARRIKKQEAEYEKKIAKKKKAEAEYYQERFNLGQASTEERPSLTAADLASLDATPEPKKMR